MYVGDALDAYAYAPAPEMMTHLTIDDATLNGIKRRPVSH